MAMEDWAEGGSLASFLTFPVLCCLSLKQFCLSQKIEYYRRTYLIKPV